MPQPQEKPSMPNSPEPNKDVPVDDPEPFTDAIHSLAPDRRDRLLKELVQLAVDKNKAEK